jgi:hypothetical protein
MITCPHMRTCALYPKFAMQATLRFWQARYCEAEYTRCARYQATQRGEVVAVTLLPNGERLGQPAKAR